MSAVATLPLGHVEANDGIKGNWRVESFEVSKQDSAFSRIRAMQHPEEYVPAGVYKRLIRGREVIMSNTPMEIRTNKPIIWAAKGCVLINGLGLGMVVTALMQNPTVEAVTVIENSEDVIKLVGPSLNYGRLTIVHADAFSFKPPAGRYGAVWHDIWDNIRSDNLEQMTKLTRKYARRADWQGCWCKAQCLRARQTGY